MRRSGLTLAFAILLFASATADGRETGSIDPPAAPGAFAVELQSDGDGVLASWIEPGEDGPRVRSSRLSFPEEGPSWSPPSTIVAGRKLFANWADRPKVRRAEDGSLLAHHLEKLGDGTYAYGIRLSASSDQGATWQDRGWLHDDERSVEHGFASMATTSDGVLGVWLDGRAMPEATGDDHGHGHASGGAMSLRAARWRVGDDDAPASIALDARVCECCDTDIAWTSDGPIVVYRDRGPNEERDISIVRLVDGSWTMPAPVHRDDWVIEGCPVNGPSVAADGRRAMVAWFTQAPGKGDAPRPPRLLAAMSSDAGATFGDPWVVSDRTIGRTQVVPIGGGEFVACWVDLRSPMAFDPRSFKGTTHGSIALQRFGPDGPVGSPTLIDAIGLDRMTGFPRLAVVPPDERTGAPLRIVVAWRDGSSNELRADLVEPPR